MLQMQIAMSRHKIAHIFRVRRTTYFAELDIRQTSKLCVELEPCSWLSAVSCSMSDGDIRPAGLTLVSIEASCTYAISLQGKSS